MYPIEMVACWAVAAGCHAAALPTIATGGLYCARQQIWIFNVRFGSKADICGAQAHVRFTPKATSNATEWNSTVRMSELLKSSWRPLGGYAILLCRGPWRFGEHRVRCLSHATQRATLPTVTMSDRQFGRSSTPSLRPPVVFHLLDYRAVRFSVHVKPMMCCRPRLITLIEERCGGTAFGTD